MHANAKGQGTGKNVLEGKGRPVIYERLKGHGRHANLERVNNHIGFPKRKASEARP